MTVLRGSIGQLKDYFLLVRWPNLAIMALTMFLVRYAIVGSLYNRSEVPLQMPGWQFVGLVLASVLIASGGYIINDVLDTGLDRINKPSRQLVGGRISEKAAMLWYYTVNIIGVGLGFLVSFLAGKIEMGILFIIISTALYYYSFKYKYLPFWGNFTVSLLSALVVAIVWIYEFFNLKLNPEAFTDIIPLFRVIIRLVLGYTTFAFLLSMNREMIKDIQDMEGDKRYGCNTIPIMIGLKKARLLAACITLVTMAGILFAQFYLFGTIYNFLAVSLSLIQLMLLLVLIQTVRSAVPEAFAKTSRMLKWTMLAGILSMVLIFYANLF